MGRDTLDLLLQFPVCEFAAAEFIALLNPCSIGPIRFLPAAIAIGCRAFTVASVRYESHNRQHKGVCSTFLADLIDDVTKVHCFFTPNKVFRVPEDNNLPMIMVGPGTGIAPFRAFLQERQYRNAPGKTGYFLAIVTPQLIYLSGRVGKLSAKRSSNTAGCGLFQRPGYQDLRTGQDA